MSWDIYGTPESESLQAEREIWDDISGASRTATESEAHAEWHRNAGVPIGTPGCPQDACHVDCEPDYTCDQCKRDVGDTLSHNERTGLALCESCDLATEAEARPSLHDRLNAEAERQAERDTARYVEVRDGTSERPVTFKRLRSGAWGVTGPDVLLRSGSEIAVTKRNGSTSTVTVGSVLWSGDGRAIATIR